MWKHLRHPNVIPFLGATLDPPQLVSSWILNRGLMEYVTVHPEKNRLGLVSSLLAVSGEVFIFFASYMMSLKAWTTSIRTVLFTGISEGYVDANDITLTH